MKKMVIIGGGTGSYTVLSGLKDYAVDITAIPSMFDNGGHTGQLRDEYGVLPPGDVRRCLIALSEHKTWRDLFTYRFSGNNSSLGNLLLTALKDIHKSDVYAIKEAGNLLNIRGKVLPVSINQAHLCAKLSNNQIIKGETNIDVPKHDPNIPISKIFLEPEAHIYRETYNAIIESDVIILGPGDLFTSIIPNLIVKGVCDAIKKSQAKIIYICNLMTKHGETTGFCAEDHVRKILEFISVDVVICNSNMPSLERIKKYATEYSEPVKIKGDMKNLVNEIRIEDLMSEKSLVRHNSKKLAKLLMTI